MSNGFIIARNMLRLLFRKRINMFIYIILPAVIVITLVNLMSTESGKIKVGIYNKDKNGILAKDFVRSIGEQSRYKLVYLDNEDVGKMLTSQKADCVVIIPKEFDEKVYDGSFKTIDIKSIKGQDATVWIKNYIDFYIGNLMRISRASDGNREAFNDIYKGKGKLKVEELSIKNNHTTNQLSQMGVGFVTMFMLMGASTVSGIILKDRRLRTYYRIFTAPVSSKVYLMGNFLAGMFLLLLQAAIISFSITEILKLDMKVTGLELFSMLATFAFVSSALGSVIVAFAKNSNQAGYISTFIITPSSMISGCFWPIDYMPKFMQKLSYFFPQRWLIEGVARVQESGYYSKAFPCMAIILGFAVVLFLVSMFKIKMNKSVKNFV